MLDWLMYFELGFVYDEFLECYVFFNDCGWWDSLLECIELIFV